jgi:adenylosuccinate synthase
MFKLIIYKAKFYSGGIALSKKLENNGIWESSGMIFTEYREAMFEQNRQLKSRLKPIMHEKELGAVAQGIGESYATRCKITLILFEPFVDREVVGVVVRIEQYSKRIRLELSADEYEWIKFEDILNVV